MILPKSQEWREFLSEELASEGYYNLCEFVEKEYLQHECYPPQASILRALDECSLSSVKVVIVGQDPYYNEGQANGLCFSSGAKPLPPSLINIFKAIKNDYPSATFASGDLGCLARQGVLLLNSCLSVETGRPLSHRNKGWEIFTKRLLNKLNNRGGIAFMLWGNHAQALIPKESRLEENCYLDSVHPSPLSAYRGFYTCGHFKKCNDFLRVIGKKEIEWSII